MIELADIKKQLRIHENFTDDDDFLMSLLDVAKEEAENYIQSEIVLDENTPPTVRQAILIKICDLYDVDRGTYTSSAFKETNTFERLLNFHKTIAFL